MALAYDLYILRDNLLLQSTLINRLKNKKQFQGARYELYVTACFIKSGFDIVFEDETDKTQTHCEFVATHKISKKKYSVEAKSRHRMGFLGQEGNLENLDKIKLRIGGLLNSALNKRADYERIIFVDVNMPPEEETTLKVTWFMPLSKIICQTEKQQKDKKAFLFFTNHPNHYLGNERVEPNKNFLFTGINIPEFKQPDLNLARKYDPIIFYLWDSINNHIEVPHEFKN